MTIDYEQHEGICSRLIGLLQDNEILQTHVPDAALRGNLFEQGLMDSMGAVHMLELISQEFGVDIDMDLLVGELTTIDAICRFINLNQLK